MLEILSFVAVGVFTGLSAGLLGVGGGIISVPAMIILLPLFGVSDNIIVHVAIATSLSLIIPTALISAYSHHLRQAINWHYVLRLTPGLMIGSLGGVYIALMFDRVFLQLMFAVFLMIIAIYMSISNLVKSNSTTRSAFFIPGVFIGGISSMMGVGGGTMVVPFFIRNGLPLKKAIASSSACGLPIAFTGSVMFYIFPNNYFFGDYHSLIYMPAFMGIFVGAIIFAPVGAKLTQIINTSLLKKIFVLIIFLTAVKLMFV